MSSILETFFILFESDASKVEKGADNAEKATDKLEQKVKKTDKAVAQLGAGFLQMTKSAVASITAAVSAGAILAGVVTQAEHINMLRQTSERLNVNIGEWQAWSRAVEAFGGSAGGLEGTLRGLNANLSEIALKGTSGISPFLSKLGIRIRKTNGDIKSSLELLPELADAFEGLSRQQVEGIGAKLGLDSGTILMLMQGRRAVEEYIQKQRELGVVTERQAKIAESYTKQVKNTRVAFEMLFTNIGEYVLPILEKLWRVVEISINALSKYGREIAVFSGIVAFMLAPVLFSAATAAWGLATAVWAALVPFLPFIAAATLLGLAVADLWAYMSGAPSAVGAMIEAFKPLGPKIIGIFQKIDDFANMVLQGIIDGLRMIANLITFGGFDKIVAAIGAGKDFLISAQSSPLGAQSSASLIAGSNTQSRNVQIGEVKIETQATDADGISKEIGKSLNDEMNRTLNNYDDGIAG